MVAEAFQHLVWYVIYFSGFWMPNKSEIYSSFFFAAFLNVPLLAIFITLRSRASIWKKESVSDSSSSLILKLTKCLNNSGYQHLLHASPGQPIISYIQHTLLLYTLLILLCKCYSSCFCLLTGTEIKSLAHSYWASFATSWEDSWMAQEMPMS